MISTGFVTGNRTDRDVVTTTCGMGPSCAPGAAPSPGNYKFRAYSFTNNTGGASPDCFTVTFTTTCTGNDGLISAAYLGTPDFSGGCTNQIADMGNNTTTVNSYSFNVANGASVTVVVWNRVATIFCASPYDIAISPCPGSPTLATLESFNAGGYDTGNLLEWKTSLETDNLGYNIYRERGGKRTRINDSLIAGSALISGPGTVMRAGRSYSFWDDVPSNKRGVQYWLEEIQLDGLSLWHGPILPQKASTVPPERGRQVSLERLGGSESQVDLSRPVERVSGLDEMMTTQVALTGQTNLGSQRAAKISIRREGLYRVTQPELAGAGFDLKGDSRNLQLFVDGLEQPMNVLADKSGQVTGIEFYGTGTNTAYTGARTYWLVSGSQQGMRFQQVKGEGPPTSQRSFSYTVERRERSIYFSGLRNGDKENFFGPVIARDPITQSLTIQHLDQASKGESVVEVALQGVTEAHHSVGVQLNGVYLGDVVFEGQTAGVARFPVPQSMLKEGTNQIGLTAMGGLSDVTLTDYARITYQHAFTADGNVLRMTVPGRQQVTVGGFTNSAVRVLDVTNPNAVQELTARVQSQKGGISVTVAAQDAGQRRLIAFTDDQALAAAGVVANQPSNWRAAGNAADLVIIAHRDFLSSVAPLAQLRQSQGYSVAVVDVEDAYDEFGFGQKSPQAIKDFLAYAKSSWKKSPSFVLFVGRASQDPRNYLGYGDGDFVPTKLFDSAYMETVSDDGLADFNNDGLPDLAVGRLPVRTAAEAVNMVSKIISYEGSRPADEVLLVADSVDDFDFETASDQLKGLITADVKVEELDRGQMDPATAKSRLINAVNRGQKIVNYMGHGNMNQWRGNLLTNEDAKTFTNADHLAVFVSMTCLNGYFQDVASDSLAESLMKAERGGAVAVWASSGMTLPSEQAEMNQQLYRLIFSGSNSKGQPVTLGEAAARAKAAITDGDIRRTWILFGDPTMKLR